MKGLMVLLLIASVLFPAAGFAAEKKELPPNQLMVTREKASGSPVVAQRILFTENCIVIQFSQDRVVTNPYGSLQVIYTDERGKPHKVFVDHQSGYILAGKEVIPFPAKLVNLANYDPFID